MKQTVVLLASGACSLLMVGLVLAQQTTVNLSQQSYQQARQILAAGVEATGGLTAMRAGRNVALEEVGTTLHAYQSADPAVPFTSGPYQGKTAVDYERGRLYDEQKFGFPGVSVRNKTVIDGKTGYNLDLDSKVATAINSPSVATNRVIVRKFPHLLLLDAHNRPETLRYLGEDTVDGKKQQIIAYARDDGRQVTLYFDAGTKLLTKSDYFYTDPAIGDSQSVMVYTGYRRLDDLQVPTGRVLYNSGEPIQRTEYTRVSINSPIADEQVQVPEGFKQVPATPPSQPKLTTLAEDIYLVENVGDGYNAMFIAFNDYVLVVDAAEPIPFARTAGGLVELIKRTVPNKPIKYAVLTHHHADHAGGVRAFVAEGATVVTTPNNRAAVEQLLTARHTLVPDPLAGKSRTAKIEFVQGKRVFRDSRHLVEFYDVGPNPHAKEILVAWLPQQKILFEADLLTSTPEGLLPPAQAATRSLEERLQALKIVPERIIPVHGRTVTYQQMRASLAQVRTAEQ